jgi:flagella basal body P-ring formation protein FlgA
MMAMRQRRNEAIRGWVTALVLGLGCAQGAHAVAQAPAEVPDPFRRALVSAVMERMGRGAEVVVGAITPEWTGSFTRLAIDPSAKIGGPVGITVYTGPATSVRVRADIKVVVDYLCATRPIAGGQILAAADVTAVHGVIADVPFRRLPGMAEVIGARGLRQLAPGDVIQPGFVAVIPLVRAGQTVTGTARIGTVEASWTFVAVDSGALDEVIRILNPDTKKTLRARVVSTGLVEVINVQ